VSRYLHLNPIQISRFEQTSQEEKKDYLATYAWSSYLDYISSSRYGFLFTEKILAYFKGRKASYRSFVEEGISESVNPLEKGKGHGIVGNTSFIRDILKPTASRILAILKEHHMLKELQPGRGRRAAVLAFSELLNIAEERDVF
jgi:hypothetical protein